MSWWSDVVLAIESAMGGEANVENTAGPATATVPAGPITGLVDTIQAIYAGVTDGKFWRSLGWLLLGIVLMLMGAVSWIGMSRNPLRAL
jgi:hypothetical protein